MTPTGSWRQVAVFRAEVRRSFITTTVREESQVTPQVGFELETNGFQFYAIANLDKTSFQLCISEYSAHPRFVAPSPHLFNGV